MMQQLLDWIITAGYGMMALVVFVETGLLVGFFLPGDSLLFTAGLACVPGNPLTGDKHFDLLTLNAILIPAAILGDTVGYWIGYKAGTKMYEREQTLFFRKDHLIYTKKFYEKHGGKTIILARFVPIIRTFAPVVAGIGQMDYKRFLFFNVFGGVFWVSSLSILGYYLGQYDIVKKNLEVVILLIIFISILPGIIAFVKAKYFDKPDEPEAPAAGAGNSTEKAQS
jgi:membrane-associated protein